VAGRHSRVEILERAKAQLSSSRLVHACLAVDEPDGAEIIRCGGLWDPSLQCYVDPTRRGVELQVQRVRLQDSQVEAARGLARWIEAARRGDRERSRAVMLGGNPGSGKTFLAAGIFCHLVALEWPGDQQFASNLNTDNRRECVYHMGLVGRPEWITEVDDPRDQHVEWCNGSRLTWVSARNEKKLRQRGLPIRHILINEAQLQPDTLYATAQQAGRNLGGLVTITMNPPTNSGGNWTSRLWFGIQAKEGRGEVYQLYSQQNAAVDHSYIDESGELIRIAAPRLASAEVDGIIQIAGTLAYPTFDGRAFNLAAPLEGGNVGDPPQLGWRDITGDLTAKAMGGQIGAERVVLVDFQKRPGIVGEVVRYYQAPPAAWCPLCDERGKPAQGCRIMHVERQVAVRGVEPEFSQALIDAGYSTNGFLPDGQRAPSVLLIGDATGARQNAEHRKQQAPSFLAMKADGWIIVPPSYHWKRRTPWNPDVLESLAQMYEVLRLRHLIVSPACKQSPAIGIPSLVESLKNAPRWEHSGKLKDEGGYQHGPDGLRYGAWWGLPRPKPQTQELTAPALSIFDAVRKKG
jgi:hypothetical protein